MPSHLNHLGNICDCYLPKHFNWIRSCNCADRRNILPLLLLTPKRSGPFSMPIIRRNNYFIRNFGSLLRTECAMKLPQQ